MPMKNILTFFLFVLLMSYAGNTKAQSDTVYLPNVFSPNYDGINDLFNAITNDEQKISNYQLVIFDRYGVKVFESTRLNHSWDGRTDSGEPCSAGFYYCILKCTLPSGDKELKECVFLTK